MSCLDEETILAFCRGTLADDGRARALEHIASCDECRALVSAVARSTMGAQDPAMAPTTPLGGSPPKMATGPARAPVEAGDVLAGKYEVERVLGAGGMGVVVAARHTQLDRRVALKFLLPAACEVPGAVTRFVREGKAAARITSEHVARVTDVGMLDGGAPYLVMEDLDGEDLGAVAKRRGRIPADEAALWVLQACEAIAEAHELGIVHRDLKPANLFLVESQGGGSVKVLDFGISKMLESATSGGNMTQSAHLLGSPMYMSPEQITSARDVDSRSDIWSLGIVLYEMLSGTPPFQGESLPALCMEIVNASPPPLAAAGVPPGLEAVVMRCLAKARDERFNDVAELALALEPFAPARSRLSVERIAAMGSAAVSRSTPPPPSREDTAPSNGSRQWALTQTDREGRTPRWIAAASAAAVATALGVGLLVSAHGGRHEDSPRAPGSMNASAAPSPVSPTANTPTGTAARQVPAPLPAGSADAGVAATAPSSTAARPLPPPRPHSVRAAPGSTKRAPSRPASAGWEDDR